MGSNYRTRALCALLADIQNGMFFFHTKEDVPPTVGDSSHQAEFFELQSRFSSHAIMQRSSVEVFRRLSTSLLQ